MTQFCTPIQWNTPEIKKIIFDNNINVRNVMQIEDMVLMLTYQIRDAGPGALSLTIYRANIPIASVNGFEAFTHNCGARAIYAPRIYVHNQEVGELWIRTIEAYLYNFQFSLILASDGGTPTNSGVTHNFISQYHRGKWIEVSKPSWINRRMGAAHKMNLWCRYLNDPLPDLTIDWSYHGLIPQSKPTIQEKVKTVIAQSDTRA